jgi:hypothetical protein
MASSRSLDQGHLDAQRLRPRRLAVSKNRPPASLRRLSDNPGVTPSRVRAALVRVVAMFGGPVRRGMGR